MRKRKPMGPSLIERAVIEKQVRETFAAAKEHAAHGLNSNAMVNTSGRMFFVVLGAAIADGIDPELPEIRILRGACNAMYEQAGEHVIPDDRRASILSGLEACYRLLCDLDYDSVVKEAFTLHTMLKSGGNVDWHQFERRIARVAA